MLQQVHGSHSPETTTVYTRLTGISNAYYRIPDGIQKGKPEWDITIDFTREPQRTLILHGLQLTLLCGTWHLRQKQKQPAAATALALPTYLTNVNGPLISYLPPTTTKCAILNQFAKHGILTGVQAAHLPTVLTITFAGIAVPIPK